MRCSSPGAFTRSCASVPVHGAAVAQICEKRLIRSRLERRGRQAIEIERQQRLWRRPVARSPRGRCRFSAVPMRFDAKFIRASMAAVENHDGAERPAAHVGRLEQLLPHVRERAQRAAQRIRRVSRLP